MPIKKADPDKFGKLDLDVYSIPELVARIGCKDSTIYRAIKLGHMRALRLGGSGGYRVHRSEVERWIGVGGDGEGHNPEYGRHQPVTLTGS